MDMEMLLGYCVIRIDGGNAAGNAAGYLYAMCDKDLPEDGC